MASKTKEGRVHSTRGMANRTGARGGCVGIAATLLASLQRQSLEHRGQWQPVAIGRRQRVDERLSDRTEQRRQPAQRVGESLSTAHRLVDLDEGRAQRYRQELDDLDDGLRR